MIRAFKIALLPVFFYLLGNLIVIGLFLMWGRTEMQHGILNKDAPYLALVAYTIPLLFAIWAGLRALGVKFHDEFRLPAGRDLVAVFITFFFLLNISNLIGSRLPEPGEALQMIIDFVKEFPFIGFVMIVILAPVLEEILFRGIILKHLLKVVPPFWAILISALLFGLVHFNMWQAIAAVLIGMFMGYVYWRTGSLFTSILLHLVNNLLGFIMILIWDDATDTLSGLSITQFVTGLSVNALLFYISFRYTDRRLKRYPKVFYLASGNPHKYEEFLSLMPGSVRLKSLRDLGFQGNLKETGNTLEENSLQKARQVADTYGVNVIADDTGLEVDALQGAPGVYSARYAGANASAEENRKKLLEQMLGKENRNARFKTVISLIQDHRTHQFSGTVNGRIALQEEGSEGFGYDPVFIPENQSKTFALMSLDEKNRFSHRAKAIEKLIAFLLQN